MDTDAFAFDIPWLWDHVRRMRLTTIMLNHGGLTGVRPPLVTVGSPKNLVFLREAAESARDGGLRARRCWLAGSRLAGLRSMVQSVCSHPSRNSLNRCVPWASARLPCNTCHVHDSVAVAPLLAGWGWLATLVGGVGLSSSSQPPCTLIIRCALMCCTSSAREPRAQRGERERAAVEAFRRVN